VKAYCDCPPGSGTTAANGATCGNASGGSSPAVVGCDAACKTKIDDTITAVTVVGGVK